MNKELLKALIENLSKDYHKALECLGDLTDEDVDETNKCMGYCLGIKHTIDYLTNIYYAI